MLFQKKNAHKNYDTYQVNRLTIGQTLRYRLIQTICVLDIIHVIYKNCAQKLRHISIDYVKYRLNYVIG